MPRKKGNKQSHATSVISSVIYAKCACCQVVGELKACELCQYPKCVSCIEKHRQEDKLYQRKTKIDFLHQQTSELNHPHNEFQRR